MKRKVKTGKRHEAREAYRRALELNPGSETTRTNLMVLQGRTTIDF